MSDYAMATVAQVNALNAAKNLLLEIADEADDMMEAYENQPATKPGVYRANGKLYKVQISRESGHAYAKVCENDSWVYARGVIYSLKAKDLLTYEEAVAYGKATGICVCCQAELTDPDSVEAGIGPVCEKRWFGSEHRKARVAAKKAAAKAAKVLAAV